MNIRTLSLLICLNLFTPSVLYGGSGWVDWSTGASQPFSSSAGTGTVSYADSFQSVVAGSVTAPDIGFPFTNPINLLNVYQTGNASITFTFNGVSPDNQTIFTLGNLRPTNEFLISAYDNSNTLISLTAWTNLGQYAIYTSDTGLNLWDPSTGELVGNGNVPNLNSENIFLGLTGNTAKIVVDYVNVDGGFEYLDFGLGQSVLSVPEPSSILLACIALLGVLLRCKRKDMKGVRNRKSESVPDPNGTSLRAGVH